MANGRRALSSSASRGTLGKSLLCQSGVMWITELATNTITAESRIGSHSDIKLTIGDSLFLIMSYRSVTWPADLSRSVSLPRSVSRAPPPSLAARDPVEIDAQAPARLGGPGRPPHRACADPSDGAFRQG